MVTVHSFAYKREVLQKFCVVDPFSTKNWQMDSNQKNFILQVITYFSTELPYLVRHYSYHQWVCWCFRHTTTNLLFKKNYSQLLLVCPTLNFCTHRYIVIVLCAKHHTILAWISLPETFSRVKNWITFCCSSLGTASGVAAIVIF